MNIVSKVVGERRSAEREAALWRELKRLPEEDRLSELVTYLSIGENSKICSKAELALKAANRSLVGRELILKLLTYGLAHADASTIQSWLKWLVPKLGLWRIIKHLNDSYMQFPEGVKNAHYWLPQIYNKENESKRAEEQLILLDMKIREGRGAVREL